MTLQEKCDAFVDYAYKLVWRISYWGMQSEGYPYYNLVNPTYRWLTKGDFMIEPSVDTSGSYAIFKTYLEITGVDINDRELEIFSVEYKKARGLCKMLTNFRIPSKCIKDFSFFNALKKSYARTGRRLLNYYTFAGMEKYGE